MSFISGYHHLTLSTDGAQEDYDFYTKTLGLHSIKRTVLFDGVIPVYHLYYGAKNGDASTIVTTFPFKKPGIYGKRGTNQSKIIQLSIPVGSAEENGALDRVQTERFGVKIIVFLSAMGAQCEVMITRNERHASFLQMLRDWEGSTMTECFVNSSPFRFSSGTISFPCHLRKAGYRPNEGSNRAFASMMAAARGQSISMRHWFSSGSAR